MGHIHSSNNINRSHSAAATQGPNTQASSETKRTEAPKAPNNLSKPEPVASKGIIGFLKGIGSAIRSAFNRLMGKPAEATPQNINMVQNSTPQNLLNKEVGIILGGGDDGKQCLGFLVTNKSGDDIFVSTEQASKLATGSDEAGSKMVMCASTGNTSASAAAYAAKAGMGCCVIIPEGKIAMGKLSQAMMHGAIVLQIAGNFDKALDIVREVTAQYPITLVNSVNPYRIEGQKTGAFEIVDALGKAPDYHFIPVGNAGNITACWKGYQEYKMLGKISDSPRMMGYQAAGSAPIVLGKPIKNPETIATAIRIGNPASWKQAEAARDESKGIIDSVTDEDITEAQKLLAAYEGVFCEPASAASVAGVIKWHQQRP